MIKMHTQLHLALLFLNKVNVDNKESFLLGNAYENFVIDYTDTINNDFNLGCFFRSWVKDHFNSVDLEDITMIDQLICDMEVVGPEVMELKGKIFEGKEKEAYLKIMELEKVPMPLCFVFEDIKDKYKSKLEELVDLFIKEMKR